MQDVSLTSEMVSKNDVLAAQRLYVTRILIRLPAVPADQLLEGAGQAEVSPDTGLTYMSFCATSCL